MSTTSSPAHLLGDPLVDRQVAPEPVVLLGHVGQRALAGQRQRGHAVGLVALHVFTSADTRGQCMEAAWPTVYPVPAHGHRRGPDRLHPRRQRALPRPGGGALRRQVGHRLRRARARPRSPASCARRWGSSTWAASRAALEIGAGTGYFGLNLVRAGVVGEYTATDISPGMLAALEASAARLGVPVRDRLLRGRRAALPRRLLRPGLRPRRAAPPARPGGLVPRVPARAAPRRRASPSAASRRTTATGSPPCPSAPPTARPRPGGR